MVSRCYRCGSSTQEFRTCKSCRSSTPLFQVWSASVYDGLSKAVVGKLKFGRGRAAAPTMALHMAQALPALPEWLVTHIPTANYRVRRRGYDQAQLIARHLSHLTARPYAALLARSGSSRQLGQTRAMRRKQMQHAFLPINTDRVEGRHILLIDDVLTTGATLEAAAFTLKKAGAKRVSAAVFAAA